MSGEGNKLPKYKMVLLPRDFNKDNPGQTVVQHLESLANKMAEEGWVFCRVDCIGTVTDYGDQGLLLGVKQTAENHYVATFQRAG